MEIMRQATDPEFAEILSRIREGKHTDEDMEKILELRNTDTSSWPDNKLAKVCVTNYLARNENNRVIDRMSSQKTIIIAKDYKRDMETCMPRLKVPQK